MADFYSMEEAARVLGISLDELKRKIQSGDLQQIGGGNAPQLKKNSVDEYARRHGLGSDPDVQSDLSLDDLDFNDIFLGQGESDLGAHTVGIAKSEVESALKDVVSAPAPKPAESDIQIVRVQPQGASDSDVRISPISGKKGPSDSDVTLLSSESAELDLGDLSPLAGSKPTKPGDTAVNSGEIGSSGEIPLIDADSDFDLSPSGVIDALQPESGSDFELTALDSSSEFDVPVTQTASLADVSNAPAGSGVKLAKPNDSGIGLASFDADSIELAPLDDAPVKAAPKPAPAPTPAPAKSPVKAPAAAKPSDTGLAAAASAFDDTDFELEDLSGAISPGDKTVQIESNSDFELVEQSDELSMISEPLAAAGSAVRAAAKPKPADDASSEWDLGGSSGEAETTAPAAKGKEATAKPSPALMRNVSTEWGTPWVVGLGVSTGLMLLLAMVAFDLVKNLYEFRGETPVSSGLIKQIAGILGKK